jgi:hypothetical protein
MLITCSALSLRVRMRVRQSLPVTLPTRARRNEDLMDRPVATAEDVWVVQERVASVRSPEWTG